MKIRDLLLIALALLTLPHTGSTQEKNKDRFANPHLLVTTEWAAKHAKDAGVRMVDVRASNNYATSHVPGAVNVPSTATFLPKGPRMMLGSAEQIAKLFGEQGIDLDTHVVLYDEGRSTAAARVFWTLEVYGHRKVSVLDGGFARWRAEKREITKETPKVTAKTFAPKKPSSALSTLDTVMEDVEGEETVMLDARSKGEFERGRIPMAVHIEWTDNYTEDDAPVFKSPAALLELYAEAGVTQDKRVHAY